MRKSAKVAGEVEESRGAKEEPESIVAPPLEYKTTETTSDPWDSDGSDLHSRLKSVSFTTDIGAQSALRDIPSEDERVETSSEEEEEEEGGKV